MGMLKYRKKPLIVEAEQWLGDNHPENLKRLGLKDRPEGVFVSTLQGLVRINPGDWLVNAGGDWYPCNATVFDKTFELVV